MNHNETRGTVLEVVDIKSGGQTINALKRNEDPTFTVGGILSDSELAWMYRGAFLKIISISDGTVQAAWDFSAIIRDIKAEITSVIEYDVNQHSNRAHSKEPQLCLIVSYTSTRARNEASYISFCHPRTSKILHTITSKEKITCLSLITSKKNHSCPLTGIVKKMSGSLAIGTKSGNLLIMDIKVYDLMNEIFGSSRKISVNFSQNRVSYMLIMDLKHCNEKDLKDRICKVDDDNYHVAISIPVSERKDCHSYDLEISSLMFIPRSLTLAVGFRSGIFRLWDVSTLKKLYRSSSLEHPIPVVNFGFQEPCNDPQSFCYLWVLHESGSEDACLPFAVMYGILYKNVITMQEYGRCYKNFMHCKKRFGMDVDMERSSNGRCITSSVVSNTPSNMLRHINTNEEDPSKINLFVMVFETWDGETDSNSHISLVVFDMNQWYEAQMPHQCYNGYSVPFINFVLLDRVSERKSTILDMRIKKDSIQQFLTFNLSEEYSYPSSLSFDTVFLTNTKLIHLRIPGIQRCLIKRIVAEGPSGLIKPSKYFTECKKVGLRPCFSDNYGQAIVPSQIQQRNYILTILLEHKISNFLVSCVNEWADGSRAVSGCTLPNLIQWAWDCVTRIKQLSDTICIPLFDYSGDDLDRENYQKLKHCCQLLQFIRDLLSYTWKNFKHFLSDCLVKELNHQVETLHLVTKYFDVIIWCLDVGMLPEKVTSTTDRCIPTYMLNLMQFAEQRREELKSVATKDKYFLTDECTLYIIDSILENEPGGKSLRFQWERESYGMTNGLYPPVTLQSLLQMFLMSNVSTEAKHFIMMYFLLDVCDYHRDDDMKKRLRSFSVIFFPDSKFLSLVEACWLIDHKKIEEAVHILLSDSVMSLLKKNKNLCERILKTCVCQGQYSSALKCERIIKMPANFHITLLLLNELIMEAYSTLRRTSFEDRKMLHNFFKVCDELGFLKEILRLPLLPEEETEFLSYLDDCTNKDAGDFKVMYLLSRGRYVEAVDTNHMMSTRIPKFSIVGKDTQKQDSAGRTTTRDLLVNAFSKTLPKVTNDLITFCRKERDKIYRHKHITKPTPLSEVLHVDTEKNVPVYKSSFESVMQAAICKTAETWSNFPKLDRRNKNASFTQNTPFLRSELLTSKQKRCSISFRSASKNKIDEEEKNPDKAPLEVTRILNTLLENTPESSPLTSILKSSEMSRFKQPQKVGINFPERQRNTPNQKIVSVDVHATPVPEERINLEESRAKKSVAKEFDKSDDSIVEEEIEVHTTVQAHESSIESSEPTDKDDSYYSLESENESMMNFVLDPAKPEEDPAKKTRRLIIEYMSDEESANDSQNEAEEAPELINTTEHIVVISNESVAVNQMEVEVEVVSEMDEVVDEEQSDVEEKSAAEEENINVDDTNDEVEVEEEYENEEEEEEYQDDVVEQKEIESLPEPHPPINYEDLEIIVSTVAAAEENKAASDSTVNEPEFESVLVYESQIMSYTKEQNSTSDSTVNGTESRSILVNESQLADSSAMSICEVYDEMQSILEETVNLSDVKKSHDENQFLEIVRQPMDISSSLDPPAAPDTKSGDNTKPNTNTKTVNIDNEPSLVFRFRKNSVTSIGDNVLVDDSNTSVKSANKSDTGKLCQGTNETSDSSSDQAVDSNTSKSEIQPPQNITKPETNPINVKCTSVKEHNFLRTSLPKCDVHIIEKVQNEMYTSDDGYDDSDVQINPISEDAPQIVECNEEPAVIMNTTHFQKSVFADQSPPTILETADKSVHVSELMSENDISVDVSIVQMSQDTSQVSQSVTEQDQGGNKTSVIVVLRDEPSQAEVVAASTKAKLQTPVVTINKSESSGLLKNCTFIDENLPKLRRSLRIAKRSINCIPGTLQENPDFDNTRSVKSGSSVADSGISNISEPSVKSNRSQRRKVLAPKTLEIILSDDELASPSKRNVRNASLGPGIGAKSTKRNRCEVGSDDDDGLNSASEAGAWRKPQKRVRKPQLNEAALKLTSTASECERLGQFVSSTPLVTTKGKSKSQTDVAAGSEEYASSRRLTRSQTRSLKYGSMNRDSNIAQPKPSTSSGKGIRKLENTEDDESDYHSNTEDVDLHSKIIVVPKIINKNRYRKDDPNSKKVRLSKQKGPRARREIAKKRHAKQKAS